ncbi:MAG: hypothetical protein ACOYN3_06480, partial [Acidimicrobiia bacterium]
DPSTLDYVKQICGDQDIEQTSVTVNGDGVRSSTESINTKALASAGMLRRMRPGEGLVVYGHLLPAKIVLRPWYKDTKLKSRSEQGVDPVPVNGNLKPGSKSGGKPGAKNPNARKGTGTKSGKPGAKNPNARKGTGTKSGKPGAKNPNAQRNPNGMPRQNAGRPGTPQGSGASGAPGRPGGPGAMPGRSPMNAPTAPNSYPVPSGFSSPPPGRMPQAPSGRPGVPGQPVPAAWAPPGGTTPGLPSPWPSAPSLPGDRARRAPKPGATDAQDTTSSQGSGPNKRPPRVE